MWLLNTRTYALCDFSSVRERLPPYAILSHCWGPEPECELTFADIRDIALASEHPGWSKVENACRIAREDHDLDWIWIDTCCIDKSSSAELSLAINSMFAWYTYAKICLAYLNDVRADEDHNASGSSFRSSRWFTRGWTLQELIAPRSLLFLSRDWKAMGYKATLADTISEVTSVDARVLCCSWVHYGRISVAKRMSWAAGRTTTQPEDRAYSLMGIFYVNMPTLYGEGGRKAFQRLQMEIIRQCPDHSVFAWGARLHRPLASLGAPLAAQIMMRASLLASSPDEFRNSAGFEPISIDRLTDKLGLPPVDDPHYHETNYGIRIQLPLRCVSPGGGLYCALLAVQFEVSPGTYKLLGLPLQRRRGGGENMYHCLSTWGMQSSQRSLVPISPTLSREELGTYPLNSEDDSGDAHTPHSPPEWQVKAIYIAI